MCQRWAPVGLVGLLLAGCLAPGTSSSAAHGRWINTFQGPAAKDVMGMDVAILERPVGDLYLNRDLWTFADEQIIIPERRAIVEANGFRVGQVGALPPEGLQGLLTNGRSCPDPRRIQTRAGSTTTLRLGPTLPRCLFAIHDEMSRPLAVALDEADCNLLVIPSMTLNGRTRLQFVPEVAHGRAALLPQPAADRSGWELQSQRPSERYSNLGWDVVLGPGDYLVVGARYDRPDTLGHCTFIRTDPPTQRLLVIRAGRFQPEPLAEDSPTFGRAPSIASQAASYSAARGHSP